MKEIWLLIRCKAERDQMIVLLINNHYKVWLSENTHEPEVPWVVFLNPEPNIKESK